MKLPSSLNFEFKKSNPLILLISGLSGAGKDSVIELLREETDYQFHFVITCNTRDPRPDEIDGVHYHFVTREKFHNMIDNNELVEYSPVYSDFKGVPKFEIEKGFEKKQDLILRLDYQGVKKVKQAYPEAISIFLIPPDAKIWLDRLIQRGADSDDELRVRIKTAENELDVIPEFDYLIINDQLKDAVADLRAIVQAEHLRPDRFQIKQD